MDGEQGEARVRSRRHDGKDAWSLKVASPLYEGAIVAGDLVALNFTRLSVDYQGSEELLWVEVLSASGDVFEGALDNQPTWIRGLSDGDVLAFERSHVVRAMRSRT